MDRGDVVIHVEVLSLLSLLVQKYLVYWYKSTNTDIPVELPAGRCGRVIFYFLFIFISIILHLRSCLQDDADEEGTAERVSAWRGGRQVEDYEVSCRFLLFSSLFIFFIIFGIFVVGSFISHFWFILVILYFLFFAFFFPAMLRTQRRFGSTISRRESSILLFSRTT